MNVNNTFGFNVSSLDGTAVTLTFHEIQDKKEASVTVGGRSYKLIGDEKTLAAFSKFSQALPTLTFGTVKEFKISLKQNCQLIAKTVKAATQALPGQTAEAEVAALTKIHQSNGSSQEIKKIVKELSKGNTNLGTLMNIAATLAKTGDTIKASHFFFHVQFNAKPAERQKIMSQMSQAFLEFGMKNNDPIALDFAIMHGLNEEDTKAVKERLTAISVGPHPIPKAQAELALARMEIYDLLNPIQDSVNNEKQLDELKKKNPAVQKAFERAESIQQKINMGIALAMDPPVKLVDIKGVNGKNLSLHVNISGSRASEKDPIVIFESGLGCFSPDWQFVQDGLKNDKILTLSYDRAGMGWSGDDGAPPTIERTIANLEALLDKLNLKGPYLFVGHSYGGFVGQLFTMKHPDDVKELILVDSGLETVMPTYGPPGEPTDKRAVDYLPPAVVDFISHDRAHEVGDKMAMAVHMVTSKESHNKVYDEEFKHYKESGETLKKALGASEGKPIKCPLKVITAGIYLDVDRALTEQEEKGRQEWMAGQKDLLKKGSESEQIMAQNSDHNIMHKEPEKIVSTIQAWFGKR